MSALMMRNSTLAGKVSARPSVAARAAGNWRPGSAPPAWLKDANIPGNFGFDPLRLGQDAKTLLRFREAIEGRYSTYLGNEVPLDLGAIVGLQLVAMTVAEGLRGQNSGEKIYPGGAFDPMGMSKDKATFEKRKLQEIKNGRLAMMACVGLLAQTNATGTSPLANLADHVASPYTVNFATNGISLPFSL
eukprot:gene16201-22364_t